MASRLFLRAGLASAVALGGCHLLGGADDLDFDIPPGPSGPAGPGGGDVGGGDVGGGPVGGGGEGGGGCAACDSQCGTCEDEVCTPVEAGTVCTNGRCDGYGRCATGDILWSRRFGSTVTDDVRAVAAGFGSPLAVAGEYRQAMPLPGGNITLPAPAQATGFVALIDPTDGDAVDALAFTGSAAQRVTAMAASAEGYFVGGTSPSGASVGVGTLTTPESDHAAGYVAAFDASNMLDPTWMLGITAVGTPNPGDQLAIHDVTTSPNGNHLAIVGALATTSRLSTTPVTTDVTLQSDRETAFVAVVNQSGSEHATHVWSAPFTFPSSTAASAIRGASYAPDGALWLVGDYKGSWNLPQSGQLPSRTQRVGFVARYNPGSEASYACSNPFTTSSTDEIGHAVHDVAALADGGAVIVASFSHALKLGPDEPELTNAGGELDLVIAKLSSCTTVAWSIHIPNGVSGGVGRTPSVVADAAGNVIVVGSFIQPITIGDQPHTPLDNDAYVIKLNGSDGTLLWHHVSKVTGSESAYGAAVTASGQILVGGGTEDPVFGSTDPAPFSTNAFATLFGP